MIVLLFWIARALFHAAMAVHDFAEWLRAVAGWHMNVAERLYLADIKRRKGKR